MTRLLRIVDNCSHDLAGLYLASPLKSFWLVGFFLFAGANLLFAGAEEDRLFYQMLRESGHDRLASEMLDLATNDPLISQEFRDSTTFERITLGIAQARAERNSQARQAALKSLGEQLDQLAKGSVEGEQSVLIAKAMGDLATAMADDARRQAIAVQISSAIKKQKSAIESARKSLIRAEGRLTEAASRFEQEHTKLRGVPAKSAQGKLRLDLLGRLAQARLMSARLQHERAMTYASNSKQYKELNQTAAEQLGKLYEKYNKWMVGLYAHLYEGKSYRALGEVGMAAGCFEALIAQPTSTDELRSLVTHAQAELAALWVDAGEPAKALEGPWKWLNGLGASQLAGSETAMLRYHLGRAQVKVAMSLKADSRERRNALREANEWLSASAKTSSEIQFKARLAWNQVSELLGVDQTEPENFEQAYQAGKRAIDAIASARATLSVAQGIGNDARQELEDQVLTNRDSAERVFKSAMTLSNPKTDPAQLNESRYLLAWLTYESGEYARAAKMANYLINKAPKDVSAEKAALLGLATLERLALNNDPEAGEQLKELAKKSIKLWPGSDVAGNAVSVLLNDALRRKSYEEAESLLAGLNESDRAPHALSYATSRWEQMLADPNASATDRQLAVASLRESFEAIKKQGKVTTKAVTAGLYLAKADLAAGKTKQAVKLLLDPKFGAIEKLSKSEPPADTIRFATYAAQTAVLAYVQSGDEKLSSAMEWYTLVVDKGDPANANRTRLSLAVELMKNLDDSQDDSQIKKISPAVRSRSIKSVSQLIGKVSQAIDSNDWNTQTWIAQTYLRLGELSESEEQQTLNLQAASKAFNQLVEKTRNDKNFAPTPSATLAVRLQAANCDLRLKRYDEALAGFEVLLAERPSLLEVQTAAAEALQTLGKESGDASKLEQSIAGARPDSSGKNVIWGWRKIAAVTARAITTNEKYEELFFRAWLNVARGRYLVGKTESGASRANTYRKATSTLRAMRRQHPSLGGDAMSAQYDKLEKEIGRAM